MAQDNVHQEVELEAPQAPVASSSTPLATSSTTKAPVKNLILDAGPLLSLLPLRGTAQKFYTVPLVLNELRDKRAREHWERLKLVEGTEVIVREPGALALSKVIAFAKQTGDFAVLSTPDLHILALTYALEVEENGHRFVREELGKPPKDRVQVPTGSESAGTSQQASHAASSSSAADEGEWEDADDDEAVEDLTQSISQVLLSPEPTPAPSTTPKPFSYANTLAKATAPPPTEPEASVKKSIAELQAEEEQDVAEESPESDGEGEWITPSNVSHHKSLDMGLIPALNEDTTAASTASPSDDFKSAPTTRAAKRAQHKIDRARALALANGDNEEEIGIIKTACMTGDYAVQNVLLQMGLKLVGEGGKRIGKVKSWVLRCHACFKICKDSSKKFCPSCGNATLMRTSISTSSAPDAPVQVHLKQGFQYHLRGTKYSIPDPKPGRAKGQQAGGSGLILREDQKEFQSAVKREEMRREREDRKLRREVENGGGGRWNDPDWLPDILVVGNSGKGRQSTGHGLPAVGHGRSNPNQARRKRK